ncbi:MAG: hypothetical protein IPH95_18600 [Candidatus Promineofilum sp.]|nr:hypothetical protein [Promineifilum sp.]
MTELTLTLTDMAHGGLALGRDKSGRAVFVPFAIPGETVRVRPPRPGDRAARAELLAVVRPSPDRVEPRCRHFGVCGNCAFQHMSYESQLRAKMAVVRDQLSRVGGIRNPVVRPIVPHPAAYDYRGETTLFRADEGGLGYWSPVLRRIFRVAECPILQPELQAALGELDVELPDLRKLTLRLGDDDELLAALEVEGVEPPELAADFPISVAIVLPDRTAASLIGDPYLVRTVGGRPLRVSPGVAFPHSATAAEMLAAAVLDVAAIAPGETVLESQAGRGLADGGAGGTGGRGHCHRAEPRRRGRRGREPRLVRQRLALRGDGGRGAAGAGARAGRGRVPFGWAVTGGVRLAGGGAAGAGSGRGRSGIAGQRGQTAGRGGLPAGGLPAGGRGAAGVWGGGGRRVESRLEIHQQPEDFFDSLHCLGGNSAQRTLSQSFFGNGS